MRKKELQVKISFEPNRLAEVYMANAYEQIIPIIKQPILIQEKTEISTLKIQKQGRFK